MSKRVSTARLTALGASFALTALVGSAAAANELGGGTVMGWVEDSRGTPVAGAIVSLFAKGMRGGGLVTFSDDAGRFVLPALPAGSYTIRAMSNGLRPATAQKITVLPNQESILSLSLAALGELSEKEAAGRRRELSWLVRHKRRSVLEGRETSAQAARSDEPSRERLLERLAPWLPEVGGSVELVANARGLGAQGETPGRDVVAGTGALRLAGRIADVAGFKLAGLVAESEDTQWRMAAEFDVDPGAGHEIRAGAGYGTRFLRPFADAEPLAGGQDGGTVGAWFLEDRWTLSERISATAGARHSYVGFVQDRNHLDPSVSVELTASRGTRLRGTFESRTLAPGGDLLTLSTLSSAPAIVFADFGNSLLAERIVRYEMALDHNAGATQMGVRAFRESTRDQLVNAFRGAGASRSLRILNDGSMVVRGLGFDLGHEFGRALRGSVGYSYGRAVRDAPTAFLAQMPPTSSIADGAFHDITARFETFLGVTDTRFVAFYRLNLLTPDEGEARVVRNTRFDVQLSQGLPFLSPLTSADWELLLAVRNLFYETDEGATLDEFAVVNPPTRVMGGISVRF